MKGGKRGITSFIQQKIQNEIKSENNTQKPFQLKT